jgi:citrate lyase beta subunit
LVFDFEDSISENQTDLGIENLSSIEIKENHYARLRFFYENGKINKDVIDKLIKLGFQNFVIPKFTDSSQIEEIVAVFEHNTKYSYVNFKFILIVEHPLGLINLHSTLLVRKLNYVAVGFGSHDYCNYTGMKHDLGLLSIPRFNVMNIAKAHNIIAIDIACMEISSNNQLEEEINQAILIGYDAKFLIHPNQLEYLLNEYFDKEQIIAKEIIEFYNNHGKPLIFKYKGKVIEKPHIEHYIKLLNTQ